MAIYFIGAHATHHLAPNVIGAFSSGNRVTSKMPQFQPRAARLKVNHSTTLETRQRYEKGKKARLESAVTISLRTDKANIGSPFRPTNTMIINGLPKDISSEMIIADRKGSSLESQSIQRGESARRMDPMQRNLTGSTGVAR